MDSININPINLYNNEPYEVDVPALQETFEAQVLVRTAPSKKTIYPMMIDVTQHYPLRITHEVLSRKKFTVELVQSSLVNGKPTLLITEIGENKSE